MPPVGWVSLQNQQDVLEMHRGSLDGLRLLLQVFEGVHYFLGDRGGEVVAHYLFAGRTVPFAEDYLLNNAIDCGLQGIFHFALFSSERVVDAHSVGVAQLINFTVLMINSRLNCVQLLTFCWIS